MKLFAVFVIHIVDVFINRGERKGLWIICGVICGRDVYIHYCKSNPLFIHEEILLSPKYPQRL